MIFPSSPSPRNIFSFLYISTVILGKSLVAGLSKRFAAFVLLFLGVIAQVGAAELLMYRRAGCPWCLAWRQAIGPVYPKTELGRQLPLRLVDLADEAQPQVSLARPVRYSPTFVVVEEGREIGRIEGYPGEAFFWGLLDKLARALPSRPQS
jgi:hypothetical protein